MPASIRPFERADRDQLTALVNLHVAAVIPGVAVSVNAVLSQLEREPGEVVVDPWVEDRKCLVALIGDRLVAAALVHRFSGRQTVPEWARGAGDVRWLLALRSEGEAGLELARAVGRLFDEWGVTNRYADGALPAPACYGVPDVWPHVAAIYRASGFHPTRRELVLVARCEDLVGPALPGAVTHRQIGHLGARIGLRSDGEELGHIEIGEIRAELTRSHSTQSWTDVGNVVTAGTGDRQALVAALYGAAAEWLLLGGVTRLLDYWSPDDDSEHDLEARLAIGFEELVRIERGWVA